MGTNELLDEFLGPLSVTATEEKKPERLEPTVTKPSVSTATEETKTTPPEKRWGKLPKYHPKRWRYIEVGDPPHLFSVLDTNPDLEGDLTKVPIPEPSQSQQIVFTEPEKITGTIPPTAKGPEASPTDSLEPTVAEPVIIEEPKGSTPSTPEAISPIAIPIVENDQVILIPTVRRGLDRLMTDKEAKESYHKTGKYIKKFNGIEEAINYARRLSELSFEREPESKKPAIPPALPSYGQFAPPVQTAQPKPKPRTRLPESTSSTREGLDVDETLNWVRKNITPNAPDHMSVGEIINKLPAAHKKVLIGKIKYLRDNGVMDEDISDRILGRR